MKHLLLFTISPVQSFIAQARKVKDLAAGSAILSELITEALHYLKTDRNVLEDKDVIFPHPKLKDKPNRFLTYIQTENPQELGSHLEAYIHGNFINKAASQLKDYYDKELEYALNQLRDLLKIYWVIIPTTDNFQKDYEKIERLLGGIKNLRAFDQFAEKGRKCAINGEYNVSIYRHKENNRKPHWITYTDHVETKTHIKHGLLSHGEGLSTINFYKRVYEIDDNSSFNATCQIAYLDAIDLLEQKAKTAVGEICKIDEQYLYQDTPVKKGDKRKDIEGNRKILKGELKKLGIKLPKYYAVLMFDADKMGKWLSGDFLKDKAYLLIFQKRISELFGDFAAYARDYINGQGEDGIRKGQTIYAGGDDYLGLINLKYLFDVLKKLNEKFGEIIWHKLDEEFNFQDNTKAITFSAGIVIAHYKTPLSYVLNEARKAEKIAKEKAERNALAITVLKRSGEIHQTFLKWHDFNHSYLPDSLAAIISALNDKSSSNKFITSFTRLFLPVAKESDTHLSADLIKSELNRLLKDNQVESIEENVMTLFKHFNKEGKRLNDFIFLLNIADFISREINVLYTPNTF